MNYDIHEPKPRGPLHALGVLVSALVGCGVGCVGFLLAWALTLLLWRALPGLREVPAMSIYAAFNAIPFFVFLNLARSRVASAGARAMAVSAILVLCVLAIGMALLYHSGLPRVV